MSESDWIRFVRNYRSNHSQISYKDALVRASPSYQAARAYRSSQMSFVNRLRQADMKYINVVVGGKEMPLNKPQKEEISKWKKMHPDYLHVGHSQSYFEDRMGDHLLIVNSKGKKVDSTTLRREQDIDALRLKIKGKIHPLNKLQKEHIEIAKSLEQGYLHVDSLDAYFVANDKSKMKIVTASTTATPTPTPTPSSSEPTQPEFYFATNTAANDRFTFTTQSMFTDVAYTIIGNGYSSPNPPSSMNNGQVSGANQTGPISNNNGTVYTGTYRFTKQINPVSDLPGDATVLLAYGSLNDRWYYCPPLPRVATAGRSGGPGLRLRRKLRSREEEV
jgi:hypothetical protein